MKDIWVTSRNNVASMVFEKKVTHVLSLLDFGKKVNIPDEIDPRNWLLLNFKDKLDKYETGGPTRQHVKEILEFGRNLPEDAVLLVHCEAGISRSTAAATAILTQKMGSDKFHEAAKIILTKRPVAMFNPVIAEYADEYLDIGGHFLEMASLLWNESKWK